MNGPEARHEGFPSRTKAPVALTALASARDASAVPPQSVPAKAVGAVVATNPKTARILRAAKRLFLTSPFDAVSMDTIAQAANVSKGTLYARFRSKEALFSYLMAEELAMITAGLWNENPDTRAVESVLRRFSKNFIDRIFSSRALDMFRVVVGEAGRFPQFGAIFYQVGLRSLSARLARYLARCHVDGALVVPDPEMAATQFMSLVRADLFMRGVLIAHAPTPEEIDRSIEAGVALFLAGYCAPAAGRKPAAPLASRPPSA
jgi:AcrR family transcriptional regulator